MSFSLTQPRRGQQANGIQRVFHKSSPSELQQLFCKICAFDKRLHAMHAGAGQVRYDSIARDQTIRTSGLDVLVNLHNFICNIQALASPYFRSSSW